MFDFSKINNPPSKKAKNNIVRFGWVLLMVIWSLNIGLSFQSLPKDRYLDNQISETKFDKKNWEKTISGIDYSGQPAKEKKEKDSGASGTDGSSSSSSSGSERTYETEDYSSSEPSSFWSGFFKFFLIALAVVVIAFIVANMVGAEGWTFTPTARKQQPKTAVPITLENVEENIYESDLDRFIREALQKENYAQAVRLYYLAIIKELSLKRWIRWKKDKTNRDYIRELSNTNFQNSFRNVTRMFERIWYGKQKLEGGDFKNTVQPSLKDLLNDSQKASKKI